MKHFFLIGLHYQNIIDTFWPFLSGRCGEWNILNSSWPARIYIDNGRPRLSVLDKTHQLFLYHHRGKLHNHVAKSYISINSTSHHTKRHDALWTPVNDFHAMARGLPSHYVLTRAGRPDIDSSCQLCWQRIDLPSWPIIFISFYFLLLLFLYYSHTHTVSNVTVTVLYLLG